MGRFAKVRLSDFRERNRAAFDSEAAAWILDRCVGLCPEWSFYLLARATISLFLSSPRTLHVVVYFIFFQRVSLFFRCVTIFLGSVVFDYKKSRLITNIENQVWLKNTNGLPPNDVNFSHQRLLKDEKLSVIDPNYTAPGKLLLDSETATVARNRSKVARCAKCQSILAVALCRGLLAGVKKGE